MPNGTPPTSSPTVEQFRGYTDTAANTVIANAGQVVGGLVQTYYYELGWDDRNNTTAIEQLTVQSMAESTETAPWLVQTIIDLGAEAGQAGGRGIVR